MQRPTRIPLFPLDVVLLPGVPLPLHIFEPRYKLMIGHCLREKGEFGMLFSSNAAMADVGCTAEIVQKIKDYPDGRMDILTEGRAIFHLTTLLDEKEYYEGIVGYVADESGQPDSSLQEQLFDLFEKCHILLFGRLGMIEAGSGNNKISFRMAAVLPLEMEKKQAMIEMRSEGERHEFLLYWMSALLPQLLLRQRNRERAGGNGHSSN